MIDPFFHFLSLAELRNGENVGRMGKSLTFHFWKQFRIEPTSTV